MPRRQRGEGSVPHYQGDRVSLHHGNCLDVLRELPDCSVDAVVTDPPYGLANTTPEKITETVIRWANGERDYLPEGKGFMGNPWDSFVPPAAVWDDCLRVLRPGGHVLAFAGSRTVDLMTLGLRMGGFEIRDSIAWLYGSGFPKSLDVSKAIDKAAGAQRTEVIGRRWAENRKPGVKDAGIYGELASDDGLITAPATPDAERWQGFGTALKPAFEPVVVARKPLAAGTVAANVLTYGTGALNIDGCRIGSPESKRAAGSRRYISSGREPGAVGGEVQAAPHDGRGRWPANVALDESQAAALDQQSGVTRSAEKGATGGRGQGAATYAQDPYTQAMERTERPSYGDNGGASRFFYVAKAGKSERPNVDGVAHPTVKPLALMRWLVRLVTPPGGTVLEPFSGSGTTIEAALLEGFNVIGIEREAEYLPLIEARIARALATDADLFGGAA